MDNLFLTIIIAILLMGMVVGGLAIGLILTGKSKLRRGCGMTPSKDKKSKSSCSICGEKRVCDNERDDNSRDDQGESGKPGEDHS